MVKKLKLVDSQPPDVFDKLQIEGHQAATVVLMLDSPEDDVVIKAADAIYRFAEKCDENKTTLLAVEGILERLLAHLHNEEPVIRRNSCMALGSLVRCADVRVYFRRIKDTIPRIIQLMTHDESDAVLEHASLCLATLAQDFTNKIMISQNNAGLEQLVKCMNSHDPDTVKSAVEATALVLQDYEAKIAFCQIPEALQTTVDMLGAEYPVIQYHALLALTALAGHNQSRAMLCRCGIVSWIMNFLSKPERADLHVYSLILLTNCIEDAGILKEFRDAGGLLKLASLITEQSTGLTEDESKGTKEKTEKEGKGKKEKGSKGDGGRKSKNNDEDESRQKAHNVTDPDIAALPDVKEHVCRALAQCARFADCCKILHEADVEKKLAAVLVHDKNVTTQIAAALALAVLAGFEASREDIGKLECIETMTKLVSKRDNMDALEYVALAFANLSINSEFNCSELLRCGAVELLVALTADPRELTAGSAATALGNMASHGQIRPEVNKQQAASALVSAMANTKSARIQSRCLQALALLSTDSDARSQFVEASGLETVVKLLMSNNELVMKNSSWLITVLATADRQLARSLCQLGAIDWLRQIQCSVSRQNAMSELALSKLYNAHLTAKYAYTGRLDADDVIGDGFYDVGQLKDSDRLWPIENYGKADVNENRPVLLVNPRPEIPLSATPVSSEIGDALLLDKTSRSTVTNTGRSSRAGRETKTKRGQKDKDADKQKEEEQQQQQQLVEAQRLAAAAAESSSQRSVTPYSVPADPQLLHYIDEATDRIKPLTSSLEQAVALARFVSGKMGGPMDVNAPSSWHLNVQRIKEQFRSNVISLGCVNDGFFYHRALLFKVIADRIGLQTSLIRGDYGRAWNEILLTGATPEEQQPKGRLRPTNYVIDVMFEPGRLLDSNGYEASAYMTSQTWLN